MKATRKQSSTFWIAFAACLVVAAVLPLLLTSDFAVNVLVLSLIWSIMGIGWNFIGGYAGQISNGHALFYAIGAYAVAYCAQHFNMSPWLSVWIGIAISVALAFVLGKPLLRLNGAYFLIATMAVAECARVILLNSPSLGGATGIMFLDKAHSEWYTLQFKNKDTFYYLLLGITTLLVLLSKYLDKSKFGYYLRAVKANETSAQSVGINTPKYKILAYMLSAAIVSLAGSLYAPYVTYVDPYTLLPLDKSTMICLVVVMGGIGTVPGPILGAIVMTFISEYARAIFASYSGLNMLTYGILVIFIVLYLPGGIISVFNKEVRQLAKARRRARFGKKGGDV